MERQGYILGSTRIGKELIAQRQRTRIFPVRIDDKAKSFQKPYPVYAGSARVEGTEQGSLAYYWIDGRGFQPALLHILSIRMVDEEGVHYYGNKEGLFLMSLVRYADVGRPELRVITTEASDDVKERFGWNRAPIIAKGESRAERHAELMMLINDLREQDQPLDELPEISQAALEEDIPF